jgi:hypothetical protein
VRWVEELWPPPPLTSNLWPVFPLGSPLCHAHTHARGPLSTRERGMWVEGPAGSMWTLETETWHLLPLSWLCGTEIRKWSEIKSCTYIQKLYSFVCLSPVLKYPEEFAWYWFLLLGIRIRKYGFRIQMYCHSELMDPVPSSLVSTTQCIHIWNFFSDPCRIRGSGLGIWNWILHH